MSFLSSLLGLDDEPVVEEEEEITTQTYHDDTIPARIGNPIQQQQTQVVHTKTTAPERAFVVEQLPHHGEELDLQGLCRGGGIDKDRTRDKQYHGGRDFLVAYAEWTPCDQQQERHQPDNEANDGNIHWYVFLSDGTRAPGTTGTGSASSVNQHTSSSMLSIGMNAIPVESANDSRCGTGNELSTEQGAHGTQRYTKDGARNSEKVRQSRKSIINVVIEHPSLGTTITTGDSGTVDTHTTAHVYDNFDIIRNSLQQSDLVLNWHPKGHHFAVTVTRLKCFFLIETLTLTIKAVFGPVERIYSPLCLHSTTIWMSNIQCLSFHMSSITVFERTSPSGTVEQESVADMGRVISVRLKDLCQLISKDVILSTSVSRMRRRLGFLRINSKSAVSAAQLTDSSLLLLTCQGLLLCVDLETFTVTEEGNSVGHENNKLHGHLLSGTNKRLHGRAQVSEGDENCAIASLVQIKSAEADEDSFPFICSFGVTKHDVIIVDNSGNMMFFTKSTFIQHLSKTRRRKGMLTAPTARYYMKLLGNTPTEDLSCIYRYNSFQLASTSGSVAMIGSYVILCSSDGQRLTEFVAEDSHEGHYEKKMVALFSSSGTVYTAPATHTRLCELRSLRTSLPTLVLQHMFSIWRPYLHERSWKATALPSTELSSVLFRTNAKICSVCEDNGTGNTTSVFEYVGNELKHIINQGMNGISTERIIQTVSADFGMIEYMATGLWGNLILLTDRSLLVVFASGSEIVDIAVAKEARKNFRSVWLKGNFLLIEKASASSGSKLSYVNLDSVSRTRNVSKPIRFFSQTMDSLHGFQRILGVGEPTAEDKQGKELFLLVCQRFEGSLSASNGWNPSNSAVSMQILAANMDGEMENSLTKVANWCFDKNMAHYHRLPPRNAVAISYNPDTQYHLYGVFLLRRDDGLIQAVDVYNGKFSGAQDIGFSKLDNTVQTLPIPRHISDKSPTAVVSFNHMLRMVRIAFLRPKEAHYVTPYDDDLMKQVAVIKVKAGCRIFMQFLSAELIAENSDGISLTGRFAKGFCEGTRKLEEMQVNLTPCLFVACVYSGEFELARKCLNSLAQNQTTLDDHVDAFVGDSDLLLEHAIVRVEDFLYDGVKGIYKDIMASQAVECKEQPFERWLVDAVLWPFFQDGRALGMEAVTQAPIATYHKYRLCALFESWISVLSLLHCVSRVSQLDILSKVARKCEYTKLLLLFPFIGSPAELFVECLQAELFDIGSRFLLLVQEFSTVVIEKACVNSTSFIQKEKALLEESSGLFSPGLDSGDFDEQHIALVLAFKAARLLESEMMRKPMSKVSQELLEQVHEYAARLERAAEVEMNS